MPIPVILQSERAECGLACLGMVAGYYGHRTSLRELRSKFQLSIRGMTLRRLRDCAKELGLACRGVRLEVEELPQVRMPAILHWGLDHFVVLKAASNSRVVVLDPAFGRRRLSLAETSAQFTGVALEVVPTPELQPRAPTPTLPLATFLPTFRGLGSTVTAIFSMTVVIQLIALALPLNMQFTIDEGIRQGDMDIVIAIAAGFALIGLVSAVTDYLRSMLIVYVGNTAAFRTVSGLAHHLMQLPDAWFDARHPGDVLSRFTSITPIRDFLMTGAFAMVVDGFLAIGAFSIMLAYAWDMALVLSAFVAAVAILNFAIYWRLRDLTNESIMASAFETSSFIENVQRHRAIRLLAAQDDREDVWGSRLVDSLNCGARLANFNRKVALAMSVLKHSETTAPLLLGAQKVMEGEFTLGMLFAFSSYGGMFSSRIRALIGSWLNFRMLKLHLQRVGDIAFEPQEFVPADGGVRVDLQGAISLRSLRFTYGEGERAVLDGLDFDLLPGDFAVVTGESGSGKTTLLKLLTKLYVPNSGEVMVDGVNLQQVDTESYRQQLGVVMQDDDLFSGSLLENIAAGDSEPDRKRAERAAKLACIHEDIMLTPMQYATLVGHMGSAFSGGQRQRIMIARALYGEPRLFLMDEGTAHLDGDIQHRVLTNLKALGVTVLAISHDPRVESFATKRLRL